MEGLEQGLAGVARFETPFMCGRGFGAFCTRLMVRCAEKKNQERQARMRPAVEEERAASELKRKRHKRRREEQRLLEAGLAPEVCGCMIRLAICVSDRLNLQGEYEGAPAAPSRTAAEAVSSALTRKSAKIDYAVLDSLFNSDTPAAATGDDVGNDGGESERPEDNMNEVD